MLKSTLRETATTVGSARVNGNREFVVLYINDGKIYRISISSLKELLKGKKRFIGILG